MSDKIHVCHSGTSIMFTGTKAECEAHRAGLNYNTDSWKISDLEDYGDFCYREGEDAGYGQGLDNAVEF